MANPQDLSELEKDPRLFLYTSLTAGSSHIITATSRLETILKANKLPFQAIDTATDEKARRLWGRRAGKRKLPGLVKDGFVLGDLEEIEEWNEYGELKENIGPVPGAQAPVPAPKLPVKPTATGGAAEVSSKPVIDTSRMVALPGAAEIAARHKQQQEAKSSKEDAPKAESISSAANEKEKSIETAVKSSEDKEKHVDQPSAPGTVKSSDAATSAEPTTEAATKPLGDKEKFVEHLSVPASAIPSGTATPAEATTAATDENTAPNTAEASNDTTSKQYRGSEVKAAPAEEIKKVESETSIAEADLEGDDEVSGVAKDVDTLQVGVVGATGGSSAKEAEKEVPKEEPKAKASETTKPNIATSQAEKQKTEVPKTKEASAESSKPAVPKTAKVEEAKVEVPKVEEAKKAEASKTEASKAEVPKTETSKAETPKTETSKAEVPKTEASKVEVSKTEPVKAEVPKTEATKAEASKAEAPKKETSKAEEAKVEAPQAKADTHKVQEQKAAEAADAGKSVED